MRNISHKGFVLMVMMCISVHGFSQQNDSIIEKAIKELTVAEPSYIDPVAIAAKLVKLENKNEFAVIIKANILNSWHIYAFAAKTTPYITTEVILDLPENSTAVGDWKGPAPLMFEEGVFIYEGNIDFVHYVKLNENLSNDAVISCGLYYQTCDSQKCFPPQKKIIELKLSTI